MNSIFFELTIAFVLATSLGIILKLFRQPPILGYVLTGLLIGPLGFFTIENKQILDGLAQVGVALLLFIVGLELNISELKSVGRPAVVVGLGQIIFTSVVGYFISLALGFAPLTSLYVAIALTFSSTIIVVKLLSEKGDLGSLYGRITLGVLLIQDFVAILFLMALAGIETQAFSLLPLTAITAKGLAILGLILYLSRSVFPKILDRLATSSELLFLGALAWAFGLAALISSQWIGFSVEIGGFFAGLALANSSEHFQISARVKPLRDFFIVLFFVVLGSSMAFGNVVQVLPQALLLSLFVLVGNPLIVILLMYFSGYRKRTSFLTSVTVAQISEFSLILVVLGARVGHLSQETIILTTIVAIITMTISTYLILYGEWLYKKLTRLIPQKETLVHEKHKVKIQLKNHIVLVGAHRAGKKILDSLLSSKDSKKILVIDFNPGVVNYVKNLGVSVIFGDGADDEIQETAQIDKASMVISTSPNIEDNLSIISKIKKRRKRKTKIIMLAQNLHEARKLKEAGAHVVLEPHTLAGEYIAHLLERNSK